jgi:hypothetical protein
MVPTCQSKRITGRGFKYQKYRKTKIFQLQDEDKIIEGEKESSEYVMNYYKNIFTTPLDKVREAAFQMEHNKAPGPDDFPTEFYQACWNIIKDDLMAMFVEFHVVKLPLHSLNFGTIILLLKCREASHIKQYRSICLLNVSFKFFTKVATNRISQVAQKVISPSQTTFIPGRNIMEGVIVLHEILHEMHRKKIK